MNVFLHAVICLLEYANYIALVTAFYKLEYVIVWTLFELGMKIRCVPKNGWRFATNQSN